MASQQPNGGEQQNPNNNNGVARSPSPPRRASPQPSAPPTPPPLSPQPRQLQAPAPVPPPQPLPDIGGNYEMECYICRRKFYNMRVLNAHMYVCAPGLGNADNPNTNGKNIHPYFFGNHPGSFIFGSGCGEGGVMAAAGMPGGNGEGGSGSRDPGKRPASPEDQSSTPPRKSKRKKGCVIDLNEFPDCDESDEEKEGGAGD